jgi:hypothetical protein
MNGEHATPPASISEGHTPAARISMPDYVDWHMILDRELDQLSHRQQGALASLGFVALGAVLGLIAPFVRVWEKVGSTTTFTTGDLATVACFFGCAVAAVICLCLAGIAWYRNRGLADEIRKRPKHGAHAKGEIA